MSAAAGSPARRTRLVARARGSSRVERSGTRLSNGREAVDLLHADAGTETVDEVADVCLAGVLLTKTPCLDLCIHQRLDLAGDKDDLLDAEAGIDGLQALVEELGEMRRVPIGLRGADAQASALPIDPLDQIRSSRRTPSPRRSSCRHSSLASRSTTVLRSSSRPIGSAKAREAVGVSLGISGVMGSNAWPRA